MADAKLKLGNDIWATKQKSLLAYNDEGGNFKSLPFQVDRISGGTYVGRNGLVQYAASNEPRVDFTSNTKGGLLLEQQRTNLCLYSETLSDWQVLTGASLQTINDNDAIAPDGTQSASTITFSSNGSSLIRHYSSTSYTSAKHSCSFWVKKISGNGTVEFGLTDTQTEFTPTDEWVRYEVNNITPTNFGLPLFLDLEFQCSAGDKIAVWGMQLEAGTYSTSTIPTSGAAVTRVQDDCTQKPPNGILGQSEGVLFIDMENFGQVGSNYNSFLKISDTNDSTDRVIIQNSAEANNRTIIVVRANSSTLFQPREDIPSGRVKIALKYKSGDIDCFVNGIKEQFSSSTFSFANTLNTIKIQNPNKVYQVEIFDEALSDSELATLTTI